MSRKRDSRFVFAVCDSVGEAPSLNHQSGPPFDWSEQPYWHAVRQHRGHSACQIAFPGVTAAALFEQFRHEPLALSPSRRQVADKLPGLVGEGGMPLLPQRMAGGEPSLFEVSPCLAYLHFGGITGRVRFA